MSSSLLIMKRVKNLSPSEKYAKLKMKQPSRTELDLRHKSAPCSLLRAISGQMAACNADRAAGAIMAGERSFDPIALAYLDLA